MTILSRNICNLGYRVINTDVEMDFREISLDNTIEISVELLDVGFCKGRAWVEQHIVTWMPWFLVFFLFPFIKPKPIYVIKVEVMSDDGKNIAVAFDIDADPKIGVIENVYKNVPSFVREVWVH